MDKMEVLKLIVNAYQRLSNLDVKPKTITLLEEWRPFFGDGPVLGCAVRYELARSACTVTSLDFEEDTEGQVIQTVWLLPDNMTGRDKVREHFLNRPKT